MVPPSSARQDPRIARPTVGRHHEGNPVSSIQRSGRRAGLLATLAGAFVLAGGGAVAADDPNGSTGQHTFFDTVASPSALCGYPNGSPTELRRMRVRGPRVSFPSEEGDVGWVRWTLQLQRSDTGAPGTWSVIDSLVGRHSVTVGDPHTFKRRDLWIEPAPQSYVRVVSILTWIDQGLDVVGRVTHRVRHYELTQYGPDDPFRFGDAFGQTTGGCIRHIAFV
jgi:hypothetical protein